MHLQIPLLLASSSQKRKLLLSQIGISPNIVMSPNVDREVKNNESAREYNTRIAKSKISFFQKEYSNHIILTASTIAYCSKKIIRKANTREEVASFLNMLSGRRHRIYSTVCCFVPNYGYMSKTVVSIVKMKRLHIKEIEYYLNLHEWKGCVGGYSINGFSALFIEWIRGSCSAVAGLPLSQTYKMLYRYLSY